MVGAPERLPIREVLPKSSCLSIAIPTRFQKTERLGVLVVSLWVASWVLLVVLGGTPEERGQFGDMFGSVNSLFSGLALAGVVLTLFLQHRELGLQRQELRLTREQLTRTAEAHEASQASLSRQATANERAAEIQGLVAVVDHLGIRINSESNANQRIALEVQRATTIERLAAMFESAEE